MLSIYLKGYEARNDDIFVLPNFRVHDIPTGIQSQGDRKYAAEQRTAQIFFKKQWLAVSTALSIAVLVLNNVIFSNQVYMLKELEYESTISTFTRIIDPMEQTDGYVVDERPVAIIGTLGYADLATDRNEFEYIHGVGMDKKFATKYYETYEHFFNEILGYPIRLIQDEAFVMALAKRSEIASMPTFPAAESLAFVHGILIIKLS